MNLQLFLKQERPLVVYSQGAVYRPYLAPIAEEYAIRGYPVAYVTSEKADYQTRFKSPNIFPFFIGQSLKRTWFFQNVDCDVFLTTMPDLNQLHLKRSIHPVHYIYTQHSLNSLHMVYREGAFDSYDTIFAAGLHHSREVRALEKVRGTTPKAVVEQGYVFLDDLAGIARTGLSQSDMSGQSRNVQTVLLAPSWGPQGLIETHGERAVQSLIDSGFEVIIRPHPRTIELFAKTIFRLTDSFLSHPRVVFDFTPTPTNSYLHSDLLVTSWSGAAFEYALAFNKPVVHVDVARKVRNPAYRDIPIEPFEVTYRGEFGKSVVGEKIGLLGHTVAEVLSSGREVSNATDSFRKSLLFGVDEGAQTAVNYILELLKRR